MDLRDLINKLDAIEQTKLLAEAEELMEKVRIRYSDVEAVAKQYATDDDARGKALAKLAADNGLQTLFDPISGELVKADGSYASFLGADEATVNRLKGWGLLPLNAKTSSWMGARGQDRKTAIGDNQSAQERDKMVDRAEELMKKAITAPSAAPAKESIAESLLGSFGYKVSLLEYITPEEHAELKGLVQKLTPFAKSDPDSADLVAQFRAYNQQRDALIARIKEVIAAIKPAATTSTAPAAPAGGERSGGAGTPANESLDNDSEMLMELSLTPQGQKAGAKLFEPDWKGYLSPEQVKHNLALLKKGHAKLDWSDHLGKTVKDWANMATFDLADKAAAAASSAFDPNTTYKKEREKQQAADRAYNLDPNALNLRSAANAVGWKMDPNNPAGNMTIGDVLGLVGPGAITSMFKVGVKGAQKLGMGKVGQFVTGTGAVVGTQKAVDQIDKAAGVDPHPDNVPSNNPQPPNPQPANNKLKYDEEVKKIQDYLVAQYGSAKNILPRFGADGKLGKETQDAIARAKKDGKLTADGKIPSAPDQSNAETARLQRQNDAAPSASEPDQSNAETARLQRQNDAAPSGPTTATNAMADLDPKVVQDAMKKLGITPPNITQEQLAALMDAVGIKDGEEVADAGAGANASNATADTTGGPNMSGGQAAPTVMAGGGDGGLVQGTTRTAESSDLARILKLSGLYEDDDLEEDRIGGGMKFASWVIDQMIASGPRGQRLAKLANEPLASKVASPGELRAARKMASDIERAGQKGTSAAEKGVANTEKGVANAEKGVANAEKGVANVEKGVADAEKVLPKVGDEAVSKLTADAAKGEGLLYQVGKLGGRFVRFIKNNKFLTLLALLAAYGIYKIVTTDKPVEPQPGPGPGPGPAPGPAPVQPQVDPKEEERKRQLLDLEKLLAQLYGGWPTDPETAETIKAAVAAGAKAPEGFKEGGVQPQPAATAGGDSNARVFGRAGVSASAEDLAKKSAATPTYPGQGVRR